MPSPFLLVTYLTYFIPVGSPSPTLSLLLCLYCRLSAFPSLLFSVPRILPHGSPWLKNARGRPNEPFSCVTGLLLHPCGVLYLSFHFSFFLFRPFILIAPSPLTPSSCFTVCFLFLFSMERPCVKKARGRPSRPLSLLFLFFCSVSVLFSFSSLLVYYSSFGPSSLLLPCIFSPTPISLYVYSSSTPWGAHALKTPVVVPMGLSLLF